MQPKRDALRFIIKASLGKRLWQWMPLFTSLFVSPCTPASSVSKQFTVAAVIDSGCVFGNSAKSSATSLGTLNFGERASLDSNIDVTSTTGGGSIVVTCTPGLAISIAMDYGVNGGNSSSRYMVGSNSSDTIAYQLYQDAGRSVVWGTGAQAYGVSSFPSGTQSYPVYGRLFSSTTQPSAGTYTDTVTVTLTY